MKIMFSHGEIFGVSIILLFCLKTWFNVNGKAHSVTPPLVPFCILIRVEKFVVPTFKFKYQQFDKMFH